MTKKGGEEKEGESIYKEKKHKVAVRRLKKMKSKGFISTGEIEKQLTTLYAWKRSRYQTIYRRALDERGSLNYCLRGCKNVHVSETLSPCHAFDSTIN